MDVTWFDHPTLGRCFAVSDGAGILDDEVLRALALESAEPLTVVRPDSVRVHDAKTGRFGFARLIDTEEGRLLVLAWDRTIVRRPR